jgi:hypothetical protein
MRRLAKCRWRRGAACNPGEQLLKIRSIRV